MPRLRLTGAELVSVLQDLGFQVIRIRGSHHLLRHPDGRATVVPSHAGEIIGPGLLAKIMRDVGSTRQELAALLGRTKSP